MISPRPFEEGVRMSLRREKGEKTEWQREKWRAKRTMREKITKKINKTGGASEGEEKGKRLLEKQSK